MTTTAQQPVRTASTGLGPLTTTFTQPSSCSSLAAALASSYTPISIAHQAKLCRFLEIDSLDPTQDSFADDFACWPPAIRLDKRSIAVVPATTANFYSPAIICPSGHSQACSSTLLENGLPPDADAYGSAFQFDFPPLPGETVAGCCLSGYSCARLGARQTCLSTSIEGAFTATACTAYSNPSDDKFEPISATYSSTITIPQFVQPTTWLSTSTYSSVRTYTSISTYSTMMVEQELSTSTMDLEFDVFPHSTTSIARIVSTSVLNTSSILATASIYAPMFQMNWRASDLPSALPSSSVSSGAQVAIGSVTTITVFVIAMLVGFYLHSRKRKRKQMVISSGLQDKPELPADSAAEKSVFELSVSSETQELGSSETYELEAPPVVHEMH